MNNQADRQQCAAGSMSVNLQSTFTSSLLAKSDSLPWKRQSGETQRWQTVKAARFISHFKAHSYFAGVNTDTIWRQKLVVCSRCSFIQKHGVAKTDGHHHERGMHTHAHKQTHTKQLWVLLAAALFLTRGRQGTWVAVVVRVSATRTHTHTSRQEADDNIYPDRDDSHSRLSMECTFRWTLTWPQTDTQCYSDPYTQPVFYKYDLWHVHIHTHNIRCHFWTAAE